MAWKRTRRNLPRPARAPPEGPAASPLDLATSQRRREGPVVAWSGCTAPQRPTCPAFDPCYSFLLFQLGDRGAAKARRMAPPLWRHSGGVTTLRACYLNPPRTRRMPRRRAVEIHLLVEPPRFFERCKRNVQLQGGYFSFDCLLSIHRK